LFLLARRLVRRSFSVGRSFGEAGFLVQLELILALIELFVFISFYTIIIAEKEEKINPVAILRKIFAKLWKN
jgi:hypothetical protein